MVYRDPVEPNHEVEDRERHAREAARAQRVADLVRRRRADERAFSLRVSLVAAYVASVLLLARRFGMPGVFLGLEPLGLYLVSHLWRSRAGRWRKLAWTPVLLVPLYGPVLFGAFYDSESTS